ncbi:hypothetical protein CERZMDRAFT_89639 [Cercospora zeae-maydis SCOH1-5]|uniref:Uncharacterized protein n=1 Tax=Cercospora zeae-maydis SCOH1-5 TaxID=717836 RepID=A0A6A6FWU0_9PEZI|nr:hypothetical protein CERZMDRAFT_89639 [Cercospora zeae-maydis SCOH1-5]
MEVRHYMRGPASKAEADGLRSSIGTVQYSTLYKGIVAGCSGTLQRRGPPSSCQNILTSEARVQRS